MTRKLVYSGVCAALVAVFTMFPSIPNGVGGYVNLGDAVIAAVVMLMGAWGIPSAAIGSLCADLILGYVDYALGTFIVKGAMAAVIVAVFFVFRKNKESPVATVVALICSEAVMVSGYLVYETILFGNAYAFASVIPNVIQAVAGLAIGCALCFVVKKFNLKKLLKIRE